MPADDASTIDLLRNLWADGDIRKVAEGVLGAEAVWGEDLNLIPGLADMVAEYLDRIRRDGMRAAVESILE